MKYFALIVLFGCAAANEFDWMYDAVDRPLNWTIMDKRRYTITWQKANGDPHAMIGDDRFSNESLCFDFGLNLPNNIKLNLWSLTKQAYSWSVVVHLSKKNQTTTGHELHHDAIDEVILRFGNQEIRATRNNGVFDNNGVHYQYHDTFTTNMIEGSYVQLVDKKLIFFAAEGYVFQVFNQVDLMVELYDGWVGGHLSGILGRIHEYRIMVSHEKSLPSPIGERAVCQINSVNERTFEVEKILHHHRHAEDGTVYQNECWHPLHFVDSNKYAYDLNQYIVQ